MTSTNSSSSIAVFSGGSAANSLVDVFESIRRSTNTSPLSYIIPISDNGGSSSELIRVFGGPGIGDVRSRLVRLIPPLPINSPGYREREAIRSLFNHRLSGSDSLEARRMWWEIVDGTSSLWNKVSSAKKELIRSIFNLVNLEVIKRSRPPGSTFDFTSASVGNLFLTGARLFTGSFESAIYLLGSICGISDEEVKVIPSINSNFSHHIAAGLEDGSVIVGQNAISHPSPMVGEQVAARKRRSTRGEIVIPQLDDTTDGVGERKGSILNGSDTANVYHGEEEDHEDEDEEEDANLPGTLPTLRTKNITFNKSALLNEDLPAKISRIWYINPYGQEILPPANPRAVAAISQAQTIIYSIGSLYTSLAPSLVLRGIGQAIRKHKLTHNTPPRNKILILNGSLDREVGPQPPSLGSNGRIFSATDFVEAIVRAGEQSRGVIWEAPTNSNNSATNTVNTISIPNPIQPNPITRPGLFASRSDYLTTTLHSSKLASQSLTKSPHLFHPPPPLLASTAPTREPSPSPPQSRPNGSSTTTTQTTEPQPTTTTPPDPIYATYITHLLHLPNSKHTPYVDKEVLLNDYGIKSIEVRGYIPEGEAGDEGMRYDIEALREAIELIIE